MNRIKRLLVCLIGLLLTSICACSSSNSQSPESSERSLQIVQETEHGLFFSPDLNEVVEEMIGTLADAYEANYKRITDLFQYEPASKTVIHVYSKREQFIQMIGRDTEGTYVADEKIIKVYTPSDLSDPQIKADFTDQVVHELVHAVIQQINPNIGSAKWLDEGTAYYVSGQLEDELHTRAVFPNPPTLEQFADREYFNLAGGEAYLYSGTMVRYIVDEYGIGSFNEMIRNPDQFESIVNDSTEDVYHNWITSLQQNS